MAAEMDKHHARVAHRRRLGKLNRNLGRIANRRKQRFTPKVSCLGLFGLLDCWTDGCGSILDCLFLAGMGWLRVDSGSFVPRWDGFCLRPAPPSSSTLFLPNPNPLPPPFALPARPRLSTRSSARTRRRLRRGDGRRHGHRLKCPPSTRSTSDPAPSAGRWTPIARGYVSPP